MQLSFSDLALLSYFHLMGNELHWSQLQTWTTDVEPAILDSNGLRLESYGTSHRIYPYAERRPRHR